MNCKDCGAMLPSTSTSRRLYCDTCRRERKRATLKRHYERNRDAVDRRNAAWYREHKAERLGYMRKRYDPAKRRAWDFQKRYGITPEEYEALSAKQCGLCGICQRPPGGKRQRLHVDHCHATGAVRALLCHRCNGGLGMFDDDPQRMRQAAAYLETVALQQQAAAKPPTT